MKKLLFFLIAMSFLMSSSIYAQKVKQWVSTDREKAWQMKSGITTRSVDAYKSITINRQQTGQTIKGFGACFNELGWVSLSELSEKEREAIFQELFSENGMNLTINRMPVGANDFSTDYYSYDDVDGDFEMENFSIAHDENTLIPFIKSALAVNPEMYLWASPWCPPAWMKINKHYACSTNWSWTKGGADNKLPADLACVVEGMDVFTQVPRYLSAYAKYFGLFIDAYKQKGIKINMVMPQNEPNSAQPYPVCLWSPKGLINFIQYLGPEMEKRGVDVYLGTIERADPNLTEEILNHEKAGKYIKGCGFQWAGKDALPIIRKNHPLLPMFQTEQECGDGKNDWKGVMHSWDLMKHYFSNGVTAYDYWNISLFENGLSHWGWSQNSLITVNKENKTYQYTPEAYLLKHFSHFVKPGAKLLNSEGTWDEVLSFLNPDGTVVVVVTNKEKSKQELTITIDGKQFSMTLPSESVNTIVFQ